MKTGHFKKILFSVLAASLLIVALLIPSFAETDAERELAAANAEVTTLEQKVADATTAYNTAQANSRKGTYGFFQWAGAENALKALDNAKYKNLIAYGTSGDATALDNLEAALQLIDEVNEYRAGEGLSPLVVTDTMMAMAQADADAFYDMKTAPKQFTVDGNRIAENLGTFANAKTAADTWYAEKKVADQHPEYMDYSSANWSKVGHYYNLSQKKYVVTGAAVNTRLGNKFCQVYFSNSGNEKTYTTAQYRERIAEYRATLDGKKQELDEAQKALATAKVRQATAQRIVDAEKAEQTTASANA